MVHYVKRDGKQVSPLYEAEDDAFRWLMRHTSFSADWAIKHEGYRIVSQESGVLHDEYLLLVESGRLAAAMGTCGAVLIHLDHTGQNNYHACAERPHRAGYHESEQYQWSHDQMHVRTKGEMINR